ncbi:MAG: hypothetical protein U0L10_02305, partial [Lachnospiraceae bacterium]|nr:hypothetical protein [Lachnospiraceae bacterium]
MNLKIPRLNTKEKKNRRTDPAGNPASDAAPDDFSSGSYNPEEAEGAEHSRDAEAGTPERRVDTSVGTLLRGYAVWAVLVLAVCILLELVIFNYDHWGSPRGRELTAGFYEPAAEDGHEVKGDFLAVLGPGLELTEYGTFEITDNEKAYIELQEIHAEVENIYLHVIDPASAVVYYSVQYTDSANASLRELGERPLVSTVPESRYIRLHLTGMTRNMRICFHAENGEELHIRQIRLNVHEPLFIHPGRVAFLWLIGILLVIFGPRSWIYTTRLNLRQGRQRFLVAAVLVINIIATSWAGRAADPSVWREMRDERDYQEKEYELYADALLKGHTYLDIRPPRYLTKLRNPYDRLQRDSVAHQYDEKVLWDAAYYNGRYYVYFGIVPALLSFVPYRLVTGSPLPTGRAVLMMADLMW